jgi:hypothetical protein
VEGRELAGDAAADRVRGGVDRRLLVGNAVTYEDPSGLPVSEVIVASCVANAPLLER